MKNTDDEGGDKNVENDAGRQGGVENYNEYDAIKKMLALMIILVSKLIMIFAGWGRKKKI